MGKTIDKAVELAGKIAELAEKRARKELDALAKSGLISRKDAKQALKLAMKEAEAEKRRIRKFVEAELKRELKKAKPLIKKALAKKKKQFLKYRRRKR
jgi:Asp-tRNA(Asn)/Glu-tRNA(Gln) amidotransferase B subunit